MIMYVPDTKSRNDIILVNQFQKFGFQIHVHLAVFGVPLYSHGTNTKYRNELMKAIERKQNTYKPNSQYQNPCLHRTESYVK